MNYLTLEGYLGDRRVAILTTKVNETHCRGRDFVTVAARQVTIIRIKNSRPQFPKSDPRVRQRLRP